MRAHTTLSETAHKLQGIIHGVIPSLLVGASSVRQPAKIETIEEEVCDESARRGIAEL